MNKHRNNYRFIYNKAICMLNGENNYKNDFYTDMLKRLGPIENKASHGSYYGDLELRDLLAPEEMCSRTPWLLETGYAIREKASFEAHKNWDTNIKEVIAGRKRFFNLNFKSKRDLKWTININKNNIKTREAFGKTEFSLYEESGFIKSTEKFEIKHDCSIHFDGKYYYLLVPYQKPFCGSKAENFHVALDPGQRKFQVSYSPLGGINIIGKNASEKIYKLLLLIDKAVSKKNKNLEVKLRRRVKNLQMELHNKTSHYLCQNFRNIYVPKLTKNNDIIKNKRLRSKTIRKMVVLGHCKFVERLKNKASDYRNIKVHEITEEYTSQTCLKCHSRTKTSKEIYKCKTCKFEIDRDILGSRNILLKSWNLM
jgi:putative transposase